MQLNLIMAVCWLVVGGTFLIWHWLDPQAPLGYIRGTNISIGWIGIGLAIYNVVRWYSQRSAVSAREAQLAESLRRSREERRVRHEEPPDPNFNFSEQKPE